MYSIEHKSVHISVSDYIEGYRDVDKFIGFCKECKQYNCSWVCPPFDFDTTAYISRYPWATIIGTKIRLDDNLRTQYTPSEQQLLGGEIIWKVREILDDQLLALEKKYEESTAFFAGTCHRCLEGDCTHIQNKPCIHPEYLRHSLESLGFDLGRTASELLSIDMQWSADGSLPQYFVLISGLFSHEKIESLPL